MAETNGESKQVCFQRGTNFRLPSLFPHEKRLFRNLPKAESEREGGARGWEQTNSETLEVFVFERKQTFAGNVCFWVETRTFSGNVCFSHRN